MVPTHGLEPRTYALQVRCTTNCATSASTLFYVVNQGRYCMHWHQRVQFIRTCVETD